jgi:hypothetical protein
MNILEVHFLEGIEAIEEGKEENTVGSKCVISLYQLE